MIKRERKLFLGVGINDADYNVYWRDQYTNKAIICPFYKKWTAMITRCYSLSRLEKYQSYKGCTVCEEWLTFSNFKAWMEKQNWEGRHLDKDFLSEGTKIYSEDTCIFISAELNNFLTFKKSNSGIYPVGVSLEKKTGKYRASINHGKRVLTIGTFNSPSDAFHAWKARKKILAESILNEEDRYLLPYIIKIIDNA